MRDCDECGTKHKIGENPECSDQWLKGYDKCRTFVLNSMNEEIRLHAGGPPMHAYTARLLKAMIGEMNLDGSLDFLDGLVEQYEANKNKGDDKT